MMKKFSTKTDSVPIEVIQNLEFEILKYIRDVCDQNGLRYYLAYGTLIGAVRHQGFIPWDDDVDIHMPREDYLRLVEYFQCHPHPYYKLISMETTPRFTQILSKIVDTRTELIQNVGLIERVPLGVYVDIWLLDGAGHTYEEALETYRTGHKWIVKWYRAVRKAIVPGDNILISLVKWVYHFPEKLKGIYYWQHEFDWFAAQKKYDEYEYVSAIGAGTENPVKNVWKKDCFASGTEVSFQGEPFRAPADYDAVLRPEYGDYTQLPEPEHRVTHHRYNLRILDQELLKQYQLELSGQLNQF